MVFIDELCLQTEMAMNFSGSISTVRRAVQIVVLSGGLWISSPGLAQEQFETVPDKVTAGILLEMEEGGAKEALRQGLTLRPVYRKGIEHIKTSEGFVPRLYNDAAGFCTIGYGRLLKKAPCDSTDRAKFPNGISEADGERMLVEDMQQAQVAVLNAIRPNLSDGQYAALVSFTFNVGGNNFRNSTLLRVVNAQQSDRVPGQFRRWTRAGGKEFQGLINRRERSVALYFDGQEVPKAVPRPDEDLSPIDVQKGELVKN
ncbi:lysozyme [Microvirga sp. 0TCS3.31]